MMTSATLARQFFGSIANRMFIILLAGIVAAAVVTTILANREREGALAEVRLGHSIERIEQLVRALDAADITLRPAILQIAGRFGMAVSLVPATTNVNPPAESAFTRRLQSRLGAQRQIIALPAESCAVPLQRSDRPHNLTCEALLVRLADGAMLQIQLHAPGPFSGPHARPPIGPTLPYLALFFLLIAALTYGVARMTARPIRRLADAAGALGSDLDRAPLSEAGPTEIRQAASAFNAMQARIRRQIQHRTHMLAAITHDLQTPLTRLRLRLEKVTDEELRTKLIDDLGQMQAMVAEGLDLARSMDSPEPLQRLDINSLVDSVCADASDTGQDVSMTGLAGVYVMAQPNALRRCLTNLLDNAIKYGKQARVQMAVEHAQLEIRILDAGPGLPPDQLETVFDPFFRLETSRSRTTGGTGLGLTIARNIAQNHAGTVVLRNHPAGGLEAVLRLPLTLHKGAG